MLSHLWTFLILGAIQIYMTVWGGIVSVKSLPDGENKALHRRVFWFSGILALIVTSIIGYQTYKDQKDDVKYKADASASQQKIQTELDDARAAQNTMNGELLTYAAVLGQMKDSDNVGTKELAAAIREVVHQNSQTTSSKPPSASVAAITNPQAAPQPAPQIQVPLADQTKALKGITSAWTQSVNDWVNIRNQQVPNEKFPQTPEEAKQSQEFHERIEQEWGQKY